MVDPLQLNESQKKAQRSRSVALAIVLAAFVIIVYAATFAKISANLTAGGS